MLKEFPSIEAHPELNGIQAQNLGRNT